MFSTLEAAAEALLLTTCKILRESNVEFVIVGGWSPFLRKSNSSIVHPGTRDVDVLFKDKDIKMLQEGIKNMLADGFMASAKHEFQMLRPINVDSQEFIFNVDFLHPSEQRAKPELLSDIFDLGVPDASDPSGKRWVKSIVFQPAQIVFERKLFSPITLNGSSVTGEVLHECIPLLNEAGLVLSKLNSVKQEKRPRDSFDIFYILIGENGREATNTITSLKNSIEEIDDQLTSFKNWLLKKAHVFDDNVNRYLKARHDSPSTLVKEALN